MKICILSPNYKSSPLATDNDIFAPRVFEVALANGLQKRGHQVIFATSPDVASDASDYVEGAFELIKEEVVSLKIQGKKYITNEEKYISHWLGVNYYEVDLITRTIEYCNTNNVDIIFADYPLCHFFEKFSKVPMVYLLHDPLPKSGNLEYWLYEKFREHKYISISRNQQKGEIGLNYVGNAYHGIDINKFTYNADPTDDLLFMGRMTPEKGLHVAIEVANRTNRQLKIGSSVKNKQTNDYYKEFIAPQIIADNIKAPRMFHGEDKVNVYRQAKALLFPVSWDEPFGLVMIEAMACGTPVIAYDRGSVSEIIQDGVTGFVIKPGDIDRFVEAVNSIDQIDRSACRKHVEKNFSIEQMVMRHENIYKKVIQQEKK